MTGWRIGYTIAAPDVAKDIQLVHRTMNSSINAAVQRAAIAALTEGDSLTAPMLAEYRKRREFVIDRVSRIDNASIVAPDAAFYAFIKYGGRLPATEVAARMLAGGVAVRAGSEYGPSGEGHVRLSFAADVPTLEEGLNRVERVLKSLIVIGGFDDLPEASLDELATRCSNVGRWGPSDCKGTLNLITHAARRSAAALVSVGRSVPLGRIPAVGSPRRPTGNAADGRVGELDVPRPSHDRILTPSVSPISTHSGMCTYTAVIYNGRRAD